MADARRAYIDWLRGFAVVCMIEWHVIDAWTLRPGRDGGEWPVIQLIGGFAAPLFLFLAGVAVPMAILARRRRGDSPAGAAWAVQKRGWQVFGLAHLFRFQSFLTNPNALWSGLLKPDILNILGLGLAGTSWLCGRVFETGRRRWWLLAATFVIVALTPWARMWWWPTLMHPRLEAYIRPVGNYGVFSLFPWVAFVPLGAWIGLRLSDVTDARDERRTLARLAMAGAAAFAVGVAGFTAGPSLHTGFWLWSASDFLTKSGAMLAALGASWWIVRVQPEALTAPMLVLGRTSLFVYWVHVELAFGVISYPLHNALTLRWSIPAFVAVTVAMYVAANMWNRRPQSPWIPQRLRA